jgi:histidine ammonia-lyase
MPMMMHCFFQNIDRPKSFKRTVLELDGESLTTEDLVKCGRGLYEIKLAKKAEERIIKARNFLNKIIDEERVVYGITTGFGNFSNVNIPKVKIYELQENLIRSHCCGVGPPIPPSRGRMVLALRINVLAKGHSGVSLEVIQHMIDAFNAFCISWIPEKGSVGCSGDLAPLAHLTLGLMGEGMMWSPETGWDEAKKVLRFHGLTPVKLQAKEGISLVNGTQMVTALGAEAVERARMIALQADAISALTLDVLRGTARPFVHNIHKVRPHKGQIEVAERLRRLLHSDKNPSQISESHRFCEKVQDAYSLRCIPQVHGIVHDTIEFCQIILTTELNSATDNPLIFEELEEVISNGNFHGEYPGKVLDYLAIGVHELAQISERRLERLLNKDFSGLPPFLVKEGGLNSGFMMVQVTAASLVSENKVLCHPSTVDSIPTSGGQEDHVSMGGFAARKALRVIEHVEQVLAMEYMAACQAMEFLKPLSSSSPLQEIYKLLRTVVNPLDRDRYMAADIEAVTKLLQNGEVWDIIEPYLQGVSTEEEQESIPKVPFVQDRQNDNH